MPTPASKRPKRPRDINLIAFQIVQEATGEQKSSAVPVVALPEKNPAAVALGALGAEKGGKARAAKLTPERRAAIAREAALARWAKRKS